VSVLLVKYSSPGWEKPFSSEFEAVSELRKHICESCLIGPQQYVGEGGKIIDDGLDDTPVDVIHDGVRFECRDPGILLGTACGCEYGIEEERAA